MKIRFPNNTQHMTIAGRTGSGKTHAGLWHLGSKNFAREAWVIIDTKGDDIIYDIGEMRGTKHISLTDTPARKGLHIVRPLPHQQAELDAFLWRIWARGRCGVFIDEGYMVGKIPSFQALLTQGRSKRIPLVVLTQRPCWTSRFVFSEPSFYQIFDLNDSRDWDTVAQFVPLNRLEFDPYSLEPRWSLWYDVGARSCVLFRPVPPRDEILDAFEMQLTPQRVRI